MDNTADEIKSNCQKPFFTIPVIAHLEDNGQIKDDINQPQEELGAAWAGVE